MVAIKGFQEISEDELMDVGGGVPPAVVAVAILVVAAGGIVLSMNHPTRVKWRGINAGN